MIDFIVHIDTVIFRFLNGWAHIGILDWFMPILTDLNKSKITLAVVLIIWILLLWKGGRKGRTAALLIIPVIIASDQISSHLIKQWVGRIRPCHVLAGVRLLVDCGGGLSFPSSHAVNNFAGATLFSYYYPKNAKWFFLFAGMVGWSRVYVGVHYPFDVIGGALIGSMISLVIVLLWEYLNMKYFSQSQSLLHT